MERFEALTLNMARIAALALLFGAAVTARPVQVWAQDAAPATEEAADETADAATEGETAEGEAAEGEEGAVAEGEEATAEDAAAEDALTDEAAMEGEVIENPYGLSALWNQGDFVSKGTLIILLLMSVGSWYIIFTKLFEQTRLMEQSNKVAKIFAPTNTLKEGLDALPKRNSFRIIAEEGYESAEQYRKGLSQDVSLTEWSSAALNRAIEHLSSKLQGGLSFLATVGSTAPFIGLFGTVWGIYHALVAIGMSGQASIDKVAGPVGEALIMTAIGLAVAVPAVLGYNFLVRRNKTAIARAKMFATEVQLRIASGRAA